MKPTVFSFRLDDRLYDIVAAGCCRRKLGVSWRYSIPRLQPYPIPITRLRETGQVVEKVDLLSTNSSPSLTGHRAMQLKLAYYCSGHGQSDPLLIPATMSHQRLSQDMAMQRGCLRSHPLCYL